MKTILLALTFVAALSATPICPPNLYVDSVRVDAACPGIGDTVFAIQETRWLIAFNDDNILPNHGDFDFSDFNFYITFHEDTADLLYLGSTAWWLDTLYFDGQPIWTNHLTWPGSVAQLSITAMGQPVTFNLLSWGFFGKQWLSTGTDSAWVACENCPHGQPTSEVPEPATWAMLALGLGAIVAGRRKR